MADQRTCEQYYWDDAVNSCIHKQCWIDTDTGETWDTFDHVGPEPCGRGGPSGPPAGGGGGGGGGGGAVTNLSQAIHSARDQLCRISPSWCGASDSAIIAEVCANRTLFVGADPIGRIIRDNCYGPPPPPPPGGGGGGGGAPSIGDASGLLSYVQAHAPALRLDALAAWSVAIHEGASGLIGDGGTSFGPWQLHIGGALPGSRNNLPQQENNAWAWSPDGLNYALSGIAQVAAGRNGLDAIREIVIQFERPRSPLIETEIDKAWRTYQDHAGGGQVSTPGPSMDEIANAIASARDQAIATAERHTDEMTNTLRILIADAETRSRDLANDVYIRANHLVVEAEARVDRYVAERTDWIPGGIEYSKLLAEEYARDLVAPIPGEIAAAEDRADRYTRDRVAPIPGQIADAEARAERYTRDQIAPIPGEIAHALTTAEAFTREEVAPIPGEIAHALTTAEAYTREQVAPIPAEIGAALTTAERYSEAEVAPIPGLITAAEARARAYTEVEVAPIPGQITAAEAQAERFTRQEIAPIPALITASEARAETYTRDQITHLIAQLCPLLISLPLNCWEDVLIRLWDAP